MQFTKARLSKRKIKTKDHLHNITANWRNTCKQHEITFVYQVLQYCNEINNNRYKTHAQKSIMNNYFSHQDTWKRQNELKWLKEASVQLFYFQWGTSASCLLIVFTRSYWRYHSLNWLYSRCYLEVDSKLTQIHKIKPRRWRISLLFLSRSQHANFGNISWLRFSYNRKADSKSLPW